MARGRKRKASSKAKTKIASSTSSASPSSSTRSKRRKVESGKAKSIPSPAPTRSSSRSSTGSKSKAKSKSKSASKGKAKTKSKSKKIGPSVGRSSRRSRAAKEDVDVPARTTTRTRAQRSTRQSSRQRSEQKQESPDEAKESSASQSSSGSESESSDKDKEKEKEEYEDSGRGSDTESSEFSLIRSSGDEQRQRATRRSARQRKLKARLAVEKVMEESEAEGGNVSSSSSSSAVTKRPVAKKRKRQMSAKEREDIKLFTPSFPEARRLEKILTHRFCKEKKVHEFLVKWRGYSYIHVEWKSAEDLQRLDEKAMAKIQKHRQAFDSWGDDEEDDSGEDASGGGGRAAEMEVEAFNPEFINIDCILAEFVHESKEFGEMPFPSYAFEDTGELCTTQKGKEEEKTWKHRYYLVKWCLLGYGDITWEPACAFSPAMLDAKLVRFRLFNQVPSAADRKKYAPLGTELVHTLAGSDKKSNFKRMEKSHSYGENAFSLREYQVEGVNWLLWNWCRGQSGSLLGDEMGLGKTIQCLTMLDELQRDTLMPTVKDTFTLSRGPHLIVVPLSCVLQWQREIEAWTKLNCVVYHGDEESRRLIRKYHFHYRNGVDEEHDNKNMTKGKITSNDYYRFNVIITTYEMAVRDATLLGKIHWHCLVVDEAHRLKNKQSKLVKELNKLKREYCILLTGTPIQNNMQELWCLLNFIVGSIKRRTTAKKPKASGSASRSRRGKKEKDKEKEEDKSVVDEVFENSQWFSDELEHEFMDKFGTVTHHTQVNKLHDLLRPFLLRRVKEDVEKSLPPKVETIVEVELTVEQKKLYRAIYEKNKVFLFRGQKASNGPSLMNIMMELRKCCNHPFLIRGMEQRIKEMLHAHTIEAVNKQLVQSSGKLILLDKLLHKLGTNGHRVLIFSQMVRMLDILEDYLNYRQLQFERLDGGITGADRQAAIDRFSKPDSTAFIMLLSTRAGGLGLNLCCADTVIIYDSDWNPQNDLQAQARSHRIGQTKAVKVFRLVTRKTYEMSMFERASIKLGLDKALLNDQLEVTKGKKKLSAKEINTVLKHGAYALFEEEGDNADSSFQASKLFEEASIDQILKEQSREIQYKPSQDAAAISNGFSKAAFVSEENGVKVDIDDPEFWSKIAGFKKEDVAAEEADLKLGKGRISTRNIMDQNTVRKRRGVTRMGMIEVEESSEDEKEAKAVEGEKKKRGRKRKKRKAKPKPKKVNIRNWSDRGRDDIVDGLLCLGWGKWSEMSDMFNLGMYGGVDRIKAFAYFVYVRAYQLHTVGNKWDSALRKIARPLYKSCKSKLASVKAEDADQIKTALNKNLFQQRMESGLAQKILERVELMHRIRSLYEKAERAAFREVTEKCEFEEADLPVPGTVSGVEKDTLFTYTLTYQGGLCGMVLGVRFDPDTEENIWYIQDIARGGILDRSDFCVKYDVLTKVNGRRTSRIASLVELIDLMFLPYFDQDAHEAKLRKEEETGLSSSDYEASTSEEDDDLSSDAAGGPAAANVVKVKKEKVDNTRFLEFTRCVAPQSAIEVRKTPTSVVRSSSSFKVIITGFRQGTDDFSSSTDEQASRRLVPIIDACKNVGPLKAFLISRCKFNSERAEKVVDRARALQTQKHAAQGNGATLDEAKEKDAAGDKPGASETKDGAEDDSYSEQIQTKTGWEQLKAELISRKIFASKKIRAVDYGKRTMFVKRDKNTYFYWSRQLDIHLIVGIARHGMWKPNTSKPGLSFDLIAADSSLAFAKIIGYDTAQQMFEEKRAHDETVEATRNQRAKEARKKYMERKKSEDKSIGKGKRGRKSLEEIAEEIKAGTRMEDVDVTRTVYGPSSHLPKCRVVERYLMSTLIKEFEYDSGVKSRQVKTVKPP